MSEMNDYLSKCSGYQLSEFERIKNIVLGVIPDTELVLSYGMPTFKFKGKTILHFGVFTNHLSIFPGSGSVYEKLEDELKDFRVSKGTLQFTQDNPISDALVEKIVRIRLADITPGK